MGSRFSSCNEDKKTDYFYPTDYKYEYSFSQNAQDVIKLKEHSDAMEKMALEVNASKDKALKKNLIEFKGTNVQMIK